MSQTHSNAPVRLDDDALTALAALGRAADDAGYNQETLAKLLGVRHLADRLDTVYVAKRTADRTPLNLLVHLFLLGRPADVGDDDLAGLPWRGLVSAGVLRHQDGRVGALLKLTPYRGRLVFSDFADRTTEPDYVLGTGGASATLDMCTPRRPAASALDIGTGSGVQAFLAAAHARRVVGTDINLRALNLAAAGAAVNRLANLDWRPGSLYEPVAGDCFDLITANPPFVISPESRFQYRDGGLPGDRISQAVLAHAPRHLAPGGLAAVIFNFHHPAGADWFERPLAWVRDSGCDVWLLAIKTLDALTYAADWLRTSEGASTAYDPAELDRWVDYYRDQNIEFISGGVMLLQRRPGPNWTRADHVEGVKQFSNSADVIARILASETFLAEQAALPPDQAQARFLAARPRLVPGHRLDQSLRVCDGAWTLQSARVLLNEGISFGGAVDGVTIGLLAACNGARPLSDLLAGVASQLGQSPDSIRQAGLEVASNLLRAGLLELP